MATLPLLSFAGTSVHKVRSRSTDPDLYVQGNWLPLRHLSDSPLYREYIRYILSYMTSLHPHPYRLNYTELHSCFYMVLAL